MRVFELFDHFCANLRMPYLVIFLLHHRDANSLKAKMILIKEPGEVEHLPTVLASEVIGQSLQFVEHDVFDVVVVEHRVKQEAVLILSSIHHTILPTTILVEQGLPSSWCSKVDSSILSCAIRHHSRQLLHFRPRHEAWLILRLFSLLSAGCGGS